MRPVNLCFPSNSVEQYSDRLHQWFVRQFRQIVVTWFTTLIDRGTEVKIKLHNTVKSSLVLLFKARLSLGRFSVELLGGQRQ